MRILSRFIFCRLLIVTIATTAAEAQTKNNSFIIGADISFLPQIEDHGGIYKQDSLPEDLLQILKLHGFTYIRLKLWHTPADDYNNLHKILFMATRIKEKGFKFLLDFHYSDTWADPGHQQKPAAWQGLSFKALKDSVYWYTKKTIQALAVQGTIPDMVQIGNEINSGLLWNEGRVGGNYNSNWPNCAALINEGIRGVRESCEAGDSVKIMIHYAGAANNAGNRWFFDNLLAHGVNFEIIGLSYYSWWHGTLDQVRSNLNDLAQRYQKDIIIVETAYPWTLQWYDNMKNIVGQQSQLHVGYPASVSGQESFLRDLKKIVRQTNFDRGKGICYWAPEYISVPPILSSWENNTLFDFEGKVLKSMEVFLGQPDSLKPINVKMVINTAAHWDTLQPYHQVQIRGEVKGVSHTLLPDGKKITWDANSDLVLKNVQGDYWSVTFQMFPGDMLAYKIWTGFSLNNGTFQRLGWEGPVKPTEGATANTRIFVAGQRDTAVTTQYYNPGNETKLQYWKPFNFKADSMAIYFKVNMSEVIESGRFNPQLTSRVGVRGDSLVSGGRLAWERTKLFLQREIYSVSNGAFWSGVGYIPNNSLRAGQKLAYKFCFEDNAHSGEEDNVSHRWLNFTESLIEQRKDTTLHWVFFDDSSDLSGTENLSAMAQRDFFLDQNFPNPFNQATTIHYKLARPTFLTIAIYNTSGQKIRTLVEKLQIAGNFSISWNGKNAWGNLAPSGIYLLEMKAEHFSQVRKMIVLN